MAEQLTKDPDQRGWPALSGSQDLAPVTPATPGGAQGLPAAPVLSSALGTPPCLAGGHILGGTSLFMEEGAEAQ